MLLNVNVLKGCFAGLNLVPRTPLDPTTLPCPAPLGQSILPCQAPPDQTPGAMFSSPPPQHHTGRGSILQKMREKNAKIAENQQIFSSTFFNE